MMTKVFNSTFENSLRMILILLEFNEPQTLDRLYVVDFLTVYGKTFNIVKENLNGENNYLYSEFQSRKLICREALKKLVLDGMAFPMNDVRGILYEITDAGKQFADSLHSDYASEYKNYAKAAIKYASNYTDRQIISVINRMSTDSIKRWQS